ERAAAACAEVDARATEAGDMELLAPALREGGLTALARGEFQRADQALRQADAVATEGGFAGERARAQLALCDLALALADPGGARAHLEAARAAANASGLEHLRSGLLARLGEIELAPALDGESTLWALRGDAWSPGLSSLGVAQAAGRAEPHLRRAEATARERSLPLERFEALAALARCAALAGRLEEAPDLLLAAERLLEAMGAPDGAPGLHLIRVETLVAAGRTLEAMATLDRAEEAALAAGARDQAFRARAARLVLIQGLGQPERAQRELARALDLFGEITGGISDRNILYAYRRTPAAAALLYYLRQPGGG
ncbi:MAG: hypothetical protein HZA54_01645, partial [Planctomycetes bacterium]|nr:hypothetical protein [Planctomycetota bacterium]